MKAIVPRIRAVLTVLTGAALMGSVVAQEGLVTIQGRKASAAGLLVKVKNGTSTAKVRAAKGSLGQMGMEPRAEFRAKGLMLVGKALKARASAVMTNAELEQKAKELMATGLYEYVEPDWIVTVNQVPTDTAFSNGSLWGLNNTGQDGGVAGVDVNAQAAWAVTTGAPTVIVGVVDTGIRYTHQDLAGNMWVNPGEIPGNGVDDDANGYIDDVHGINGITDSGNPMDDNNHGSHCAGTIGATANDGGQIVGVAWNVKLMALKFLSASGSGTTSDAIKCMDYGVAMGAHILSNSWGGGGYSQALRDSIADASAAGVLFVAAAGNASSNNDVTQNYPSNYDPANVVAVAAVDRTGALASFSSYGATTVDVGAPGVEVFSSTATSDTSYASFNGTSMATPHVAGVAALIKSHFPTATMQEIKSRLMATTRPLASLAGRTVTGGIVDAHAALTVAADGVLELRASAAASPLRSGQNTAFYVAVTDLTPITGATVTAALDAGTPVAFLDNGVAPDVTANDGIYSANLTVPAAGSSTTLQVTASHGAAPVTGAFAFSIISPPANDDFANRILLAAGSTQTTGTNALSTVETGEPHHPSVAGTKSVWWEWAAGTSGSVTVTTSGSNYDTTLAVYSGSGSLASLVHLGSNDDFIGLASSVNFTATIGSRYYFQVNGYGSSEGSIVLNYPSPANVDSPPVIVTQPVGVILVDGDPLSLSVTASGTAPLKYQWALDDTNIPGATAATYNVSHVAAADQGNYTVTITNALGSLTSVAVFVGVDPISVRPPNDLFVNAEPLAGATGRVSGSNLRASGESGEPNHAGASLPVESVWYRWTAPADGTLSCDTYGSSLDTTVAVYIGTAAHVLTLIAENNDSGGVQSFVSLAVTAGQVLSIAVDGAGTAESQFSLNYLFQPTVAGLANDDFANRKVVSGEGGTFNGSNITATGEAGEPVHEAAASPAASVWWAWTAPENGMAVIDTLGSDFDTVVAVYTGTDVAGLTLVTSNDDAGGPQSRVAFPCQAGTAYAIAVDGQGAAEGLITLNITSGGSEPEIVVEQPAGAALVDGGAGVSWGDVAIGWDAERTFTVRNTGGARLTSLSVRIEGASAADFVLTTPPFAPVNGGGGTTFTVRFTPTGLGSRTATLRLASNDGNENPFDISLGGSGVPPAPEIVVEQPAGTNLVDGASAVDFGYRATGANGSLVLTVRNTGTADLTDLAITLDGAHEADFSVTAPAVAPVAPGGSTSFTLQFAPSDTGLRTAALHLASNDWDENPFDIALSGRGYNASSGLDFKIVSLGTTGSSVVDHGSLTGDDRGGIALSTDRVFVTGDTATSRHALDLSGGASIGRVANGLCSDLGTGTVYVLAHNGQEIVGAGGTVSQLIKLDPLTGALTDTILTLSQSFTTSGNSGVFSGNGRVVVHNGARVYDILVPSGVVIDMGAMSAPAWNRSESWATWGVVEFFDGELHLAFRADTGSTLVRSRVPDGRLQTIALFSNLSDLASWTVAPFVGRWYFHHEYGSQFGGSTETLGYADASFEIGPPTQPPVITSPLAAFALTGADFSYQIHASRSPTSYQAIGLPAGLAVNTVTGLISGSVAVAGVYPVTLSATNGVGTTEQTLTLTVADMRTALFDDFDPEIDPLLWGAFEGTVMANTAGQAAGTGSTGNSLHFDGTGNRFATTIPLNTTGGGGIRFKIALANGSVPPWENVESGEEVVLEYSNNGSPYAQIGGPYSNRAWQSVVVGIPVAAQTASTCFRWRQLNNSGSGLDHWAIEDVLIGPAVSTAPEIVVEQPVGSGLRDGVSTVPFGSVVTGTNTSLTFTVRNVGSADLSGLTVTLDGGNAADFTVTTPPDATVVPGATTNFVVRFAPGALGSRVAALHLASNDSDENPYDVNLTGSCARSLNVLVNFDGSTAPNYFVDQTRPVSDYAPSSIIFADTTMEVLNEGSDFGVSGHSPPNFLAWNILAGLTNNSVTFEFPVPVSDFSLKTGGNSGGEATVSAYDSSDALFYSTNVPLVSALTTVAVPTAPVSRVVFTTTGGNGVIDDISYQITTLGEIAVEQPEGANLTAGTSTTSFGLAAEPVMRAFTLRNVGNDFLTGINLSLDGAHAADFSIVTPPPVSVPPWTSTTFVVRFTPSTLGQRFAALHIASNDTDENPFDIALAATAITPTEGLEGWLPPALPDRRPEGIPYHDGLPNLLKYAFNLDSDMMYHRTMAPGDISGLPFIRRLQSGSTTVLRVEFLRRVGSGLIYTPEKNYLLHIGEWTPLSSLPVVTPVNEFWERVVHEEPVDPLAVPACFGRVRVQLP